MKEKHIDDKVKGIRTTITFSEENLEALKKIIGDNLREQREFEEEIKSEYLIEILKMKYGSSIEQPQYNRLY